MTLVPLDSVLIEQVLLDLIDNAVKHTPSGAPIHIEARVREGASPNVEIEVADRGPGLSEEEAPRVFDKFHRARCRSSPTRSSRRSSRGLEIDVDKASYYLGRETIVPTGKAPMFGWRKRLFVFISRNARTATAYFGLPPNRVVELGAQIQL